LTFHLPQEAERAEKAIKEAIAHLKEVVKSKEPPLPNLDFQVSQIIFSKSLTCMVLTMEAHSNLASMLLMIVCHMLLFNRCSETIKVMVLVH